MADPIRPSFTPFPQARPAVGGAGDAARAAQRAFFSQALAQAQAPAAPTRPEMAAPVRAGQPAVSAAPVEATAQPQRVMRPGSLLDIKV